MSPLSIRLTLLAGVLAAAPAVAAPADATTDATADATATWAPTAEQEAVYRALTVRHDPPACEQLDALTTDPVGTYLYLVQHAQQPAWVSMRAASCLMLSHTEAATPHLRQWVVNPDTRGLGILVVGQLDRLPLELATELATRALTEGPDPEGMQRRLRRLETPELVALADMPIVAPATAE